MVEQPPPDDRAAARSHDPAVVGSSWRPRGSWARWAMVAVAVLLVGLAGAGAYQSRGTAGSPLAESPVLRPDSYRLSVAADGKVTLVAFVDFECDDCADRSTGLEEVLAAYDGRVTFAVRYFPSESHVNAQRAARAVEAAAQQGQFSAMYNRMLDTQSDWSGTQTPQDDRFRGFAADLGLDLAAWDAAYASDATWERIQTDIDDGLALAVTSTPGFFLNGNQIKPKSQAELTAALDEALSR
ncbi:hypothetical protein MLP_52400 [Microlunatus phosphovorus NM-1]|uniref:Thioredoxin-like fold domain-containing protein n=1 Tax=Microlunatus phosphovorus (strain ATCC 700054 / DSM 10555 / JCM 9379 / NBRC 101784 / NCIMB 13414 / VKM Ac-1990 / NM-1) TaxID=1032480 RepID=F5XIL6_MICPN|nr:thioredoxin [Microlunatus phosphovorus]BAK38254.1 hypothetical protein MLP_52400 [Microlunatus phosphovorus NM-1]